MGERGRSPAAVLGRNLVVAPGMAGALLDKAAVLCTK